MDQTKQQRMATEHVKVIRWLNEEFGRDQTFRARGIFPLESIDDIYVALLDGVILSKLLNTIQPGVLSEKKLYYDVDIDFIRNHVKSKLKPSGGSRRSEESTRPIFQIAQNLNLFIGSMAKIPFCNNVKLTSDDIITVRSEPILMGMFQLYQARVMSSIKITKYPNLVRLALAGENIESFMQLHPENILLRWVNFQCRKDGSPLVCNNLSTDLKDSEALLHVLKQIVPIGIMDDKAVANALAGRNRSRPERAHLVMDCADKIGCVTNCTPEDIMDGEPSAVAALVASIFNVYPKIEIPGEDEIEQMEQVIIYQKLKIDELEDMLITGDGEINSKNIIRDLQAQVWELTTRNNRLEAELSLLLNDKSLNKERADEIRKKLDDQSLEGTKIMGVDPNDAELRLQELQEKYAKIFQEKEDTIDDITNKANKFQLESLDLHAQLTLLQQQLEIERSRGDDKKVESLCASLDNLRKDIADEDDRQNASVLRLIPPKRDNTRSDCVSEAAELRSEKRDERDDKRQQKEDEFGNIRLRRASIDFNAEDEEGLSVALEKAETLIRYLEDLVKDLEDELDEERRAFDELVNLKKIENRDSAFSKNEDEEENLNDEETDITDMDSLFAVLRQCLGDEIIQSVKSQESSKSAQIKMLIEILGQKKDEMFQKISTLEVQVKRNKEIGDIMRNKVDVYVMEQMKNKKTSRQAKFY